MGFNSNKGLLGIGASLRGQIMLSDSPATFLNENVLLKPGQFAHLEVGLESITSILF